MGGWVVGWVGGVYELTLKLTSASTRVGVEAGAELANKQKSFQIPILKRTLPILVII